MSWNSLLEHYNIYQIHYIPNVKVDTLVIDNFTRFLMAGNLLDEVEMQVGMQVQTFFCIHLNWISAIRKLIAVLRIRIRPNS